MVTKELSDILNGLEPSLKIAGATTAGVTVAFAAIRSAMSRKIKFTDFIWKNKEAYTAGIATGVTSLTQNKEFINYCKQLANYCTEVVPIISKYL